MAAFNLSTFPEVCRLCLQSKRPDDLVPLESYRPLFDKKLSELLDEFISEIPVGLAGYLPSEVCSMCLEVFEFYHKYKQKVNFIHRFLVAFAEVKLGDELPLRTLLDEHKDYFSVLFKDLDLCNKDELLVNDMLEEYSQYKISSMPIFKAESTDKIDSEQNDIQEEIHDENEQISEERIFNFNKPNEYHGDHKTSSLEIESRELPADSVEIVQSADESPTTDEPMQITSNEDHLDTLGAIDKNVDVILLPMPSSSKDQPQAVKNCTKCKYKTTYTEAFEAHQRLHEKYDHLEGIHCTHPSCLKVFPTQQEHDRHLKEDLHTKYVCDICGTVLKYKHSLEAHLARHTGKPLFNCDYCSSSFYTKTERRTHVLSIHTDGRKCECSKCGAVFKNNKLLKQHLDSHIQERRYKCDACKFAFKTQQHLRRHHSTVHREVRYNCDFCETSYGRRDKLRGHLEKVHNVQSYFHCDICVRSFADARALEEHKTHHASPKPLECGTCLIAYPDRAAFDGHLCITYQNDYVCCGRNFRCHVHYNRHMLVEHGMRTNARVKPKSGCLFSVDRVRKHATECRRTDGDQDEQRVVEVKGSEMVVSEVEYVISE